MLVFKGKPCFVLVLCAFTTQSVCQQQKYNALAERYGGMFTGPENDPMNRVAGCTERVPVAAKPGRFLSPWRVI